MAVNGGWRWCCPDLLQLLPSGSWAMAAHLVGSQGNTCGHTPVALGYRREKRYKTLINIRKGALFPRTCVGDVIKRRTLVTSLVVRNCEWYVYAQ